MSHLVKSGSAEVTAGGVTSTTVFTAVCVCVCTLDGLNSEHKFRVWVTMVIYHFT